MNTLSESVLNAVINLPKDFEIGMVLKKGTAFVYLDTADGEIELDLIGLSLSEQISNALKKSIELTHNNGIQQAADKFK